MYAILVKYELMFSDADNITMFKPVRDNQVLIDKSTVFALQVNEDKPVPHRVNFGMMTWYHRILDDNVIFIPPSNRQGKAIL